LGLLHRGTEKLTEGRGLLQWVGASHGMATTSTAVVYIIERAWAVHSMAMVHGMATTSTTIPALWSQPCRPHAVIWVHRLAPIPAHG